MGTERAGRRNSTGAGVGIGGTIAIVGIGTIIVGIGIETPIADEMNGMGTMTIVVDAGTAIGTMVAIGTMAVIGTMAGIGTTAGIGIMVENGLRGGMTRRSDEHGLPCGTRRRLVEADYQLTKTTVIYHGDNVDQIDHRAMNMPVSMAKRPTRSFTFLGSEAEGRLPARSRKRRPPLASFVRA